MFCQIYTIISLFDLKWQSFSLSILLLINILLVVADNVKKKIWQKELLECSENADLWWSWTCPQMFFGTDLPKRYPCTILKMQIICFLVPHFFFCISDYLWNMKRRKNSWKAQKNFLRYNISYRIYVCIFRFISIFLKKQLH